MLIIEFWGGGWGMEAGDFGRARAPGALRAGRTRLPLKIRFRDRSRASRRTIRDRPEKAAGTKKAKEAHATKTEHNVIYQM